MGAGMIPALSGLGDLLHSQSVYSWGQTLVATAVNGAQFALFNPVANGRVLYVVGIDLSVSAAMEVDVATVSADPALAAGVGGAALNPGSPAFLSKIEAAVAAKPAIIAQIAAYQMAAGTPRPPVGGPWIRLAGGFGILVSSAAVAGSVSVAIAWAELTL